MHARQNERGQPAPWLRRVDLAAVLIAVLVLAGGLFAALAGLLLSRLPEALAQRPRELAPPSPCHVCGAAPGEPCDAGLHG